MWTVGLLQAAFLSFLQVNNSAIKHDYDEIKYVISTAHSNETIHKITLLLTWRFIKFAVFIIYAQNIKQTRYYFWAEQNGMNNFVMACTIVKVLLYNWSTSTSRDQHIKHFKKVLKNTCHKHRSPYWPIPGTCDCLQFVVAHTLVKIFLYDWSSST